MAGFASVPNAQDIAANIGFDDDATAAPQKIDDGRDTDLYTIDIDNTGYATEVFLNGWDEGGTPVEGSTPQNLVWPIPASERRVLTVLQGNQFGDGFAYAVNTDAESAGTAATTDPGTPPDVRLISNGGSN